MSGDELRSGPLADGPHVAVDMELIWTGAGPTFDMDMSDYEEALKKAKALGRFHRIVERKSGKTIYMFDTEGNYLELHFPTPR